MENTKNMEIFKDIKGYPGYQISNLGRIWSYKQRGRYMIPSPNNRDYMQINLVAANGKRKKELVHRLVALHFIDNPDNKPEVNHINHIRYDNRAENLEWVSHSENNTLGRKLSYKRSQEWFEKRKNNK